MTSLADRGTTTAQSAEPAMKAFVIAVGSELLGDDRLDTNSLRLTACFTRHGVELVGKSVVGDSADAIAGHLRHALGVADLIVFSGGLGPTTDDLTREAVARCLERDVHEDAAIVQSIRDRFASLGMTMPEINRRQAMVIAGARVLDNDRGTAPGLHLETGVRHLFLLPGVPRELERMIAVHLEPWLALHAPGSRFITRSLRIACRSESAVEESLAPVYDAFDASEITVLASPGDIEVRLTVQGDPLTAGARLERMAAAVRDAVGAAVYGEGRLATLEGVVGELLRRHGRTVVTAESCTGGLIAERLTAVPGSSDYFLGGLVTYSNPLKRELLGVAAATLEAHGAVSAEVAREMALGARRRLAADYALSSTGVAGPGGGTRDKPVGTVHVAVAGPHPAGGDGVDHRLLTLGGFDRDRVRRLTGQWALEMLRRRLLADAHPALDRTEAEAPRAPGDPGPEEEE